jgi:single-stranded-DNA-specific exonuclease
MMMGPPVPALASRGDACAEHLLAQDEVLVVSHIDADGLTSAAIATQALRRAGLTTETAFSDQLNDDEIARIGATDHDTVLFTDFGSGQLSTIRDHEDQGAFTPVIADHHQPADADTTYHLNPLLEGIDGASELSGAGAAYVLARALGERLGSDTGGDMRDLAALAVVGAVGDMQASGGELVGANTAIAGEGVDAGVLRTGTDLTLYGKQTRPLPKLLEYASDLDVPGITSDEAGAISFLDGLGLDLKGEGEWRTWADLNPGERQTLVSALIQRAVQRGVPADRIDGLVGTAYELTEEPEGTELRDASEFSTLLNATARYDRPDVGLGVCLGNRDEALDRARRLLGNHRRNLSEGLAFVRERGVTREDHLQWFDAGAEIRETIVGIVAGMAVGVDGVDPDRPILAFAETDETDLKVSSRGTPTLVRRGLDLSTVMHESAAAVDGEGGGHDVAAGATIPDGSRRAFLDRADAIVGDQLG